MQIQHIRNATALLSIGEHRLLVDPMLSESGAMPGFKLFGGGRRRNPLVPLPPEAAAALDSATAVVITHEHPDHFDRPALRWIKERDLPVWANGVDAPNLRRKGLKVRLLEDGALGMRFEVIRSRHGRGLMGWLMGPVAGYYFAHPGEPSLYVTGDTIMTPSVIDAVTRLRPDVILAPAGSANAGLGGDILFSVDQLVELTRLAPGQVVFNHLEALDHCPTTRAQLGQRMEAEGLIDRVHIPADGESLSFHEHDVSTHVSPGPAANERPGMQKWITARFAGT